MNEKMGDCSLDKGWEGESSVSCEGAGPGRCQWNQLEEGGSLDGLVFDWRWGADSGELGWILGSVVSAGMGV